MLDYDADDLPPKAEDWTDWWHGTAEYRTVFRLTLPTQVFWLVVYLVAFLFIAPKVFGETTGVSEGLVCDELLQVESYYELLSAGKSRQESLLMLNVKETVCATMRVAYIKGEEVGAIRVQGGSVHVFAITVLGYWHGGWIKLEPMMQYAPFFTPEQEA